MIDLDEIIFKRFARFYKRKKNTLSDSDEARVVHLTDIQQQLTLLARALTGVAIDVIPAEREGGFKGMHFLVPRRMLLFSDSNLNDLYYRFRVMYMSVEWELHANEQQVGETDVLKSLLEEYPVLQDIYTELENQLKQHYQSLKEPIDKSWLIGKMFSELIGAPEPIGSNHIPSQRKANSAQTEIKAKHADEVESTQVDKKQQEDYVLTHNFEKVVTAEEFDGGWRDFDGSDELDEHSEALSDLNLKHTVRVDEETHSVYQSDFVANAKVAESAELEEQEVVCTYPEWDRAKNTYMPDFCKVHIWPSKRKDDAYVLNAIKDNGITLRGLRKMFARFFNDLETVRHLQQGEELDTDALTDLMVDIRSGHSADERIYTSKRKLNRDISILFLLDRSLSSDGYAAGSRIIDVEKQVAILMGEVLNEYKIDFQVDGFCSRTRNYCSYTTYKEFDGNWVSQRGQIAAMEPEGYTRIGPALRHAGNVLSKRDTRSKWIVLISDGKPNDYDKYEGKYGLADVKKALGELNEMHISTHAFAIEEQARYYLPLMFGAKQYNVLSNYREMLYSLSNLCERIVKG
ncbi:MAG: VWA domain-containing protein [Flavobacteriales bacterium]|nr:VWA domain-containing protein [Flavobacteriales bacterium]